MSFLKVSIVNEDDDEDEGGKKKTTFGRRRCFSRIKSMNHQMSFIGSGHSTIYAYFGLQCQSNGHEFYNPTTIGHKKDLGCLLFLHLHHLYSGFSTVGCMHVNVPDYYMR